MIFAGEAVRFLEQRKVVLRTIFPNASLKFAVKLLNRIGNRNSWGGIGNAGRLGRHLI